MIPLVPEKGHGFGPFKGLELIIKVRITRPNLTRMVKTSCNSGFLSEQRRWTIPPLAVGRAYWQQVRLEVLCDTAFQVS